VRKRLWFFTYLLLLILAVATAAGSPSVEASQMAGSLPGLSRDLSNQGLLPTGSPSGLVAGASLVVTSKECLRLRIRPAPSSTALACLVSGEQATVDEGPIDAAGTVWWSLRSKRSAGYADQSALEEQTTVITDSAT
jgi:hypothetical protein